MPSGRLAGASLQKLLAPTLNTFLPFRPLRALCLIHLLLHIGVSAGARYLNIHIDTIPANKDRVLASDISLAENIIDGDDPVSIKARLWIVVLRFNHVVVTTTSQLPIHKEMTIIVDQVALKNHGG